MTRQVTAQRIQLTLVRVGLPSVPIHQGWGKTGNNPEQTCLLGLLSMNPGSGSQRRNTRNWAGAPTVCLLPGWWKQQHKGPIKASFLGSAMTGKVGSTVVPSSFASISWEPNEKLALMSLLMPRQQEHGWKKLLVKCLDISRSKGPNKHKGFFFPRKGRRFWLFAYFFFFFLPESHWFPKLC